MSKHKFTNDLIRETSPYLLQHAHNPVNWVPWTVEAFEKAKQEDKLILISIGYSACHWCHVMEHESFEDEEVAVWMNRNFVCIKVDREERPDVDQVYMTAVQLMTQRGGWPLNCFTLPTGEPVYGGTYFPKEQWIHVLKSLENGYQTRKNEFIEYARRLKEGINESELVSKPEKVDEFSREKLNSLVEKWSVNFDMREGGSNRAPKFMLPNNYEFLLEYSFEQKDELTKKTFDHVLLTLKKMALGGIYDQIGGGFCRYSVDAIWKVPHFEKMLYDNAQLVSLYSKAYQLTKDVEHERIVKQTISWLESEMKNEFDSYYSALDADSEGVEGKFYVWTKDEIKAILSDDYEFAVSYFNLNDFGYWEHDNYILLKKITDKEFKEKHQLEDKVFQDKKSMVIKKLLDSRDLRIKPGLDYKCLTSWNGMQIKGFVDAYKAFGDESYLDLAIKNAKWIIEYQLKSDFSLFHNFVDGKSFIDGFLEDYAFAIQAFIHLYQVTFDETYLNLANNLSKKTIELFLDDNSKMFYFTTNKSELIARKMDINDNVIPANNSVMCMNLLILGKYYENKEFIEISMQQLKNVYHGMDHYGSGYSNWAMVLNYYLNDLKEICIVGNDYHENRKKVQMNFIPNAIFLGGNKGNLPLLKEKKLKENQFFICHQQTCSVPFEDVSKFISFIKDSN